MLALGCCPATRSRSRRCRRWTQRRGRGPVAGLRVQSLLLTLLVQWRLQREQLVLARPQQRYRRPPRYWCQQQNTHHRHNHATTAGQEITKRRLSNYVARCKQKAGMSVTGAGVRTRDAAGGQFKSETAARTVRRRACAVPPVAGAAPRFVFDGPVMHTVRGVQWATATRG
jgi:hypothetical protein